MAICHCYAVVSLYLLCSKAVVPLCRAVVAVAICHCYAVVSLYLLCSTAVVPLCRAVVAVCCGYLSLAEQCCACVTLMLLYPYTKAVFSLCRAVVAVAICHWQSNASSRLTDHPQQLGKIVFPLNSLEKAVWRIRIPRI